MVKSIYVKVEYDTPKQLMRLETDALFRAEVDLWVCQVENGKIISDDNHHINSLGKIVKNKEIEHD